MLFAALFGTVVFLIRHNMPEGVTDSTGWLTTQRSGIATATALMPFAGISFLWFIGVVRDGLGRSRTGSSPPSSWAADCFFWR